MTERGILVFGAALGTPTLYLILVTCYWYFPNFPGVGPREILNGDIWMAAGMALGVFILGSILTKLDPDLRSQLLVPPDKEHTPHVKKPSPDIESTP